MPAYLVFHSLNMFPMVTAKNAATKGMMMRKSIMIGIHILIVCTYFSSPVYPLARSSSMSWRGVNRARSGLAKTRFAPPLFFLGAFLEVGTLAFLAFILQTVG